VHIGIALSGTTGYILAVPAITDINDREVFRITAHTVPYNGPIYINSFSQPVDILIPPNYKFKVYANNLRDASSAILASAYGIEYEIFRT
jgi:hypothetical protein